MRPTLVAGTLVGIAVMFSSSDGLASHDLFRYKFPCLPADACYVTQLAHVGNAFDFDPQGSAGLGNIPAVSEAIFVDYFTQSEVCTTSGLGMYAEVQDMHGRTLKYAHLSAFGGFEPGERILQGDIIGIEGNTGYTINCAPHLHLEGISTAPGLDGIGMSNITAGPTLYTSSNSIVGAINLPGAAIQQRYRDLGSVYTSWATVGWTADRTGSQEGCVDFPFCRLYVQYLPDPEHGHWGSLIDLRRHPEPVLLGGQNVAHDFNSIMVGRWAVNDAYWVQVPFHLSWLFPAQIPETNLYQSIGLPLMDRISSDYTLCNFYLTLCVGYQRFHVGYIWEHDLQGVQAPVFCPDVGPLPDLDYYVDLVDDILAVAYRYGENDDGLAPYEPWPDSRYDINGDGEIGLVDDILRVSYAYHTYCYPR